LPRNSQFAKLSLMPPLRVQFATQICRKRGTVSVKVLIAVDGSEVSRKAVAFAAKMLGRRTERDVEVTLFHVAAALPEFLLPRGEHAGAAESLRVAAEQWAESNRLAGEKLLAESRESLVQAGIPAAAVRTTLARKEGQPEATRVVAAIAIIEEMRQGNYDLVVVGRRGASASIPSLVGSVTEKVSREAYGRTLWIVD
jgi:nucleotide-binding universal stress UspA family protein